MDRRQGPNRAGFTLVEVLVAILIVALLIALLLPAIQGAIRTARAAQVTAEINNLASALASFKNTYGDYPPSRVILSETGYFNDPSNPTASTLYSTSPITAFDPNTSIDTTGGTDISYAQLTNRTLLYLRKFWPRVNYNAGGFDFDGNGTFAGYHLLSGSECLAFFLGGIPIKNQDGTYAMSGFSKQPTNPFISILNSTNRTTPNFEFAASRLLDLDHDFMPSYIDPVNIAASPQIPYAYFSSYGTNSYDPNDDNGNGHGTQDGAIIPEYEEDGSTPVVRQFTTAFPNASGANVVTSPAPNPYTSSPPIASTGPMAWLNPNSFQIISPGTDGQWGLGGIYSPTGNFGTAAAGAQGGRLPILNSDAGIVNAIDVTNGIRRIRESDNLSNFSGGRLD